MASLRLWGRDLCYAGLCAAAVLGCLLGSADTVRADDPIIISDTCDSLSSKCTATRKENCSGNCGPSRTDECGCSWDESLTDKNCVCRMKAL